MDSLAALICTESIKLQQIIINQHKIVEDIAGLRASMGERIDALHDIKAKDELLNSLFFAEYKSRRDMLHTPWIGTYDWVLDEATYAPTLEPSEDLTILWSNFPKWLKEGTSIYWISGKAASGKSTLMNYIINDESTMEALEVWAAGKPLHVLTFFLWAPGTPLQRNVEGLLRSLLYQLLEQVPDLATEIVSQFVLTTKRIPSSTERTLKAVLQYSLDNAIGRQHCFCSEAGRLEPRRHFKIRSRQTQIGIPESST
jgi:hypothetical protein